MGDLQSEIDDYYNKNDLNSIDKSYNKNLGPTLSMLRKYARPGESQITNVMMNKALASEAAGTRASNEQAQRGNAAAFGSNPTALNASMAMQQNLASQRPTLEAQVTAAKPAVAAGLGNAIGNTMMVKPNLMSAHLQPYFANESAIATQEQLDINKASATPAGPDFLSQLILAIASGSGSAMA